MTNESPVHYEASALIPRENHMFWIILFPQNVPSALYTDPNEIAQHLTLKLTDCEKLEFPVRQPQTVNEVLQ